MHSCKNYNNFSDNFAKYNNNKHNSDNIQVFWDTPIDKKIAHQLLNIKTNKNLNIKYEKETKNKKNLNIKHINFIKKENIVPWENISKINFRFNSYSPVRISNFSSYLSSKNNLENLVCGEEKIIKR
jgi:hypothetical protein